MADYNAWSIYGVENRRPPPDGWPEYVPARENNNISRHIQSALAVHRDRRGAFPLTTGEDVNVYRLTVPLAEEFAAPPQGMRVSFTAHQTSVNGTATFQLNAFSAHSLQGTAFVGIRDRDLVQGRRYEVVFAANTWSVVFANITEDTGEVALGRIPPVLLDVDVATVDGFTLSTAATGSDPNTLYFRTANGGEIYLGDTSITSVYRGDTQINSIAVGSNVVFATLSEVRELAATTSAYSNAATLTWLAPEPASGTITYRVERALTSDFTGPSLTTLTESTSAVTWTDTGLFALNRFYYRVRAENAVDVGPYTQVGIVVGEAARVFSGTVPQGSTADYEVGVAPYDPASSIINYVAVEYVNAVDIGRVQITFFSGNRLAVRLRGGATTTPIRYTVYWTTYDLV